MARDRRGRWLVRRQEVRVTTKTTQKVSYAVTSYLVTHPKLAIRLHKVVTWLRSDTQAR